MIQSWIGQWAMNTWNIVCPSDQSDFEQWASRERLVCDALSHQTAAVQRFSLTVKANESAFSNANVRQTFFLRSAREKQCSDAKRVSCVSFHIRNYHVEEGGKNLNFYINLQYYRDIIRNIFREIYIFWINWNRWGNRYFRR